DVTAAAADQNTGGFAAQLPDPPEGDVSQIFFYIAGCNGVQQVVHWLFFVKGLDLFVIRRSFCDLHQFLPPIVGNPKPLSQTHADFPSAAAGLSANGNNKVLHHAIPHFNHINCANTEALTTVKRPATAMARLLIAPSTGPISMALEVPMACAAVPSARPLAMGS